MENEMINELAEYIMAHGTIVVRALAHKDKQMLVEALEDFIPSSKDTMITFNFKEYIGNDENPAREIFFDIPKECLEQYLGISESFITIDVPKFVAECGSEDIASIYAEASGITNEFVTYCDDFETAYADYISRVKMFNSDMSAKEIASKEDYYDTVYYASKMVEQEPEQER